MCNNNPCQPILFQQSVNNSFEITTPAGGTITAFVSAKSVSAVGTVENDASSVGTITVNFLRAGATVFTLTLADGLSEAFNVTRFDTVSISSTGEVAGNICLSLVNKF
ncbi:S-Ena type endospore appendage [Bacillus bombysepticus]